MDRTDCGLGASKHSASILFPQKVFGKEASAQRGRPVFEQLPAAPCSRSSHLRYSPVGIRPIWYNFDNEHAGHASNSQVEIL
eukprot:1262868-Amphidinium_carterae.1